jgi:hypothetical protein
MIVVMIKGEEMIETIEEGQTNIMINPADERRSRITRTIVDERI